jgi:hypothetical protein
MRCTRLKQRPSSHAQVLEFRELLGPIRDLADLGVEQDELLKIMAATQLDRQRRHFPVNDLNNLEIARVRQRGHVGRRVRRVLPLGDRLEATMAIHKDDTRAVLGTDVPPVARYFALPVRLADALGADDRPNGVSEDRGPCEEKCGGDDCVLDALAPV